MSADDESNVGVIGSRIYTGGIAVQQCFIFCFTGLLIKFHRVMLRGGGIPEKGSQWRVLVYVMYFTLFTITVCRPSSPTFSLFECLPWFA